MLIDKRKYNINPDDLILMMGYTPANNIENYKTNVPLLSKAVGGQIRSILQYKNILKTISENMFYFGSLSGVAFVQKTLIEYLITEPIVRHAKKSTLSGENPDIYVTHNDEIEKEYAKKLYDLCSNFIIDGKFDKKKTEKISTTLLGNYFLASRILEFASLECRYISFGLTGLKSMKELLSTILITITEMPLKKYPLPYTKINYEDMAPEEFSAYLENCRTRVENLYNNNAFKIKEYSEKETKGKLGYLPYKVVKGSKNYSLSLRHYSLPENIKPNGKIIYLSTPLINKPEIFDLAKGKSVIEGLQKFGFDIYLEDPGNAGENEKDLDLDFYGKTIHDKFINLIKKESPGKELLAMGYCMGGTLILPYIARRAEERIANKKKVDIKKVALMASPFKFDSEDSGHGPMRDVIFKDYDYTLMKEMYGDVNVPFQIIEVGMNDIQPGVRYSVRNGFYERALNNEGIKDSAPFLYWLTHGTHFPAKAHSQWIKNIFKDNQIYKGEYCLPSTIPDLDGKPVDMSILEKCGVEIFDYRGKRDPISPTGSCVASEQWGMIGKGNISSLKGGLNRTIEKNVGHIFVVSRKLLGEFLDNISLFFK